MVVAFLWLRREPEPAAAPPGRPPFVLPVTLGEVERGTLRPLVELVGDVRAARRARLAFEAEGWIQVVGAEDGDAVGAGDLLGQVDAAAQQVQLEEAKAAVQLAQRQLDLLQAGERVEVVERLRADVATAEADLKLAELDVERGAQLLEERVVSEAAQDRNTAIRDAAAGRLANARQRLAEAEAGTRVEDIAIAEASLAAAAARVATANEALERTILQAPWSGVVVERLLDEGDYARAGDPVFDLVDLDRLEIVLELPASEALGIAPGAAAALRLDERPGEVFEARVDVVLPVADALSRNFRAVIRLDRRDPGFDAFRPGQFVRATIERTPLVDATLVPIDAVRLTDAGEVVVVAEPIPGAEPPSGPPTGPPAPWLQAAWVPIRTEATAEGLAAVEPLTGRLTEGMSIVLTGVDRAFPGVSLMPAGPPPTPAPEPATGDDGGTR